MRSLSQLCDYRDWMDSHTDRTYHRRTDRQTDHDRQRTHTHTHTYTHTHIPDEHSLILTTFSLWQPDFEGSSPDDQLDSESPDPTLAVLKLGWTVGAASSLWGWSVQIR